MTQNASPLLLQRLTNWHLCYLRSLASGLDARDAAKQFLGITHGHEWGPMHKAVVDLARAIARRAGKSAWRLLGVEHGRLTQAALPSPALNNSRPSIDAWAEEQGLDGWSHEELLEMYQAAYPIDTQSQRRQQRNQRLFQRQARLLFDLGQASLAQPDPRDPLDAWLEPQVAQRLSDAGLNDIAQLRRVIAHGGRWWYQVAGLGPIKAQRIEQAMAMLAPPTTHAVPRLNFAADRSALSGAYGANRAPATRSGLQAENDLQAVNAWIKARANSVATEKIYRRDAERFILWCAMECGIALSDATVEDCRKYMDFLQAIPDAWISRRKAARLQSGWAPFRGQLSHDSQQMAWKNLNSLFGWLVAARYLVANPWLLVNKRVGDVMSLTSSKAFVSPVWDGLMLHCELRGDDPIAVRMRFVLMFLLGTGLRASELVQARLGHLQPLGDGWVLQVLGKGKKLRLVPVPGAAMQHLQTYLTARGLTLDSGPDIPLLAALDHPARAITYVSLLQSFQSFIRKAVKTAKLPEAETKAAEAATLHWLRHTHATRFAEAGGPADVLQENLGHGDPRTTAGYYKAQIKRRQAEMEKIFGSDHKKSD